MFHPTYVKRVPVILLAAVLHATSVSGQGAVCPVNGGPGFPPPGGATLAETPVDGSAGDPGGIVWDFSGVQVNDFDTLYWGPAGADQVLVTLDGTYDVDDLPTTVLTFDNVAGGVATWSGTTHYVDPGPTPFDGMVPVRFTLTAPDLSAAASVDPLIAGAGAVVDVLTAAGTGSFSATLEFEAFHDGVWQPVNSLLQPPACADCAGSSVTAGFYYCVDPQSPCRLSAAGRSDAHGDTCGWLSG
jgi:hypothetical protein